MDGLSGRALFVAVAVGLLLSACSTQGAGGTPSVPVAASVSPASLPPPWTATAVVESGAIPSAPGTPTLFPSATATRARPTVSGPVPTPTPPITITPLPDHDIWQAGSGFGYVVQYPSDTWQAEQLPDYPAALAHRSIEGCKISDMKGAAAHLCLQEDCSLGTARLGDVGFETLEVDNYRAYVARSWRVVAAYMVSWSQRMEACLRDAEEVLATLDILPGRACTDRVEFISDVTVPDGSRFSPGEFFVKTWQLRNAGSCEWTRAYGLIQVRGYPFAVQGGPIRELLARLPQEVQPGGQISLSVLLRAPQRLGETQGLFMLVNEVGVPFGMGADGEEPFRVDVVITRDRR